MHRQAHGNRPALRLWAAAALILGVVLALASAQRPARATLEDSITYAKHRVQFRQPIANFQAIRFKIAEMAAEIEAARQLMYHAADLDDRRERCDKEASMAKWFATEMGVRVTSKALQVHGGVGVTKDFRAERYFRNARVMPIPDGTTEIQKLIIGRNTLGVSAFS